MSARAWKLRSTTLEWHDRPLILGVLNVTPDSFSDGGRYLDPDQALDRALEMEAEGADILDLGGESTRPGAATISEEVELARVLPVPAQVAGTRETAALHRHVEKRRRACSAGGRR